MAYMCTLCSKVYTESSMRNQERDEHNNISCTKKSCDGYVVDMDGILIPTVQLLNKKGYSRNRYHSEKIYNSVAIRIDFDIDIKLPNGPKGFYYDQTNTGYDSFTSIIKLYRDSSNNLERLNDITKALINLSDWAIALPDKYDPEVLYQAEMAKVNGLK
jgi:hypothetical protein